MFLSENATLIDLQRRLGEAKATPKTSGMAHWLVLPNRTPSDTAFQHCLNKRRRSSASRTIGPPVLALLFSAAWQLKTSDCSPPECIDHLAQGPASLRAGGACAARAPRAIAKATRQAARWKRNAFRDKWNKSPIAASASPARS